jgi:1,4-dihydroxy-2-naphthoate octaprenyltransferase
MNRVRVPFFTLALVLNLLPVAGIIVDTLFIQSTVMIYIGIITAVLILMIAAFYIVVAVKVVRLLNSFVANNKSKNKIRNLRRVSTALFVTMIKYSVLILFLLDSYLDHHFLHSCFPASDLDDNLRDDDTLQ